jgi:hypothetical protein
MCGVIFIVPLQYFAIPFTGDLEAIAQGDNLRFPDALGNMEALFNGYNAPYALYRMQMAAEKE